MDRRIIALSQSEDPEALYHLGLSYAHGDGVPQSFDRAVDYFYKSAKLKYTKAMYCLGEAAYLGLGDNKSKATARTYIYGFLNDVDHWHWLTRNIEHNERLTFDDYVLAAQEGDSHAQRYLMYVYCNKMLLTRNDKLCVFWAERLVAKNDIEGMLMLAGAYMNARGVQKDYNAARELLQNLLSISPDTISAKFLLAEIETREKNST